MYGHGGHLGHVTWTIWTNFRSPSSICKTQYSFYNSYFHRTFMFLLSRLMTKPTKWHVRPAKTQISMGIRPVWSESSLSAWRTIGCSATHWEHSEDSDQTGKMPRLIWVFAGRTSRLLVLSRGSSLLMTVSQQSKPRVSDFGTIVPPSQSGSTWNLASIESVISEEMFWKCWQHTYMYTPTDYKGLPFL